MIKYFVIVDGNNVVQSGFQREVPDVGPPPRFPTPPEGCTYHEVPDKLQRPESPTVVGTWDGESIVWVETATLDEIKTAQKAKITEAYLLANKTSFTFMGKEIQADEHAMKQINATTNGIQRRGTLHPNWKGFWKTLDNSYVAIPDVDTWNLMMDALEDQGHINFAKSLSKKAAIMAAENEADVVNITWDAT